MVVAVLPLRFGVERGTNVDTLKIDPSDIIIIIIMTQQTFGLSALLLVGRKNQKPSRAEKKTRQGRWTKTDQKKKKRRSSNNNNNNNNNNDDNDNDPYLWSLWRNATATMASAASLPPLSYKSVVGVTVLLLYAMNQKHMFPRPVTGILSRVFFWPTLPITASIRLGKWITPIDDTVVMGGAPFSFCQIPQRLYHEHNVRGVINLCDEYRGPKSEYEKLGMEELRLKTVDHFVPSLEDLKSAVGFIRRHEARGERVYVHCRAGHGRSAAAVFCWLLYKDPIVDRHQLNRRLAEKRHVRKRLWKQPTIKAFHEWLLYKKPYDDDNNAFEELQRNFQNTLVLDEENDNEMDQEDDDDDEEDEPVQSDEQDETGQQQDLEEDAIDDDADDEQQEEL